MMESDSSATQHDATTIVGVSHPRPDAWGKVTGTTNYPADLVRPAMLHLKVVFARYPHARIRQLETSAALAHPGVVAIFTAADVPHNAYGLIDADQPVLCTDVVRFIGDKVALVVATTQEAASAGAQLVQVDYEELPAITDARDALAANAPLVHPQRGSNLLWHVPIRKGDSKQGLASADIMLDETFTTSWQEHAYLQPDAGIAYIDEQERVVIETAGQWLHEDRRQIAAILGLEVEQVIMRYAAIGGAFGGREDLSVQHLLALAAWKLRQPVAIVWSREESIIGHHKRHPFTLHCRWGATKAGKITAIATELFADGGAYASTSKEVIKISSLLSSGCYEVPNISVDGYVAYTNNVPSGAFRGFGAPQVQFASEIMITKLAHRLGLDPVELRRRNIYREGSLEPSGNPLPAGVSAPLTLERCIAEVHQWSGYHHQSANITERSGYPATSATGHIRRGIGIACGIKNVGYSFGFPEQATATVELTGRGEIEHAIVRIGAADVGQGAHLVLKQIAAETLNIKPEQITMLCDDSSQAPNAGSASASRMTFMGGRAVHDACIAAKTQWSMTDDTHISVTHQYRAPRTTPMTPHTGACTPNYSYGYAAQAVEVEVNLLTGQVQVSKVISVHDVGKAINRQQIEGQIEGAIAQALGYTLLEHFQVKQGYILTPHLSTYLVPTIMDIPPTITPIILETADPHGPYGARGMAEMALVPFAPAVASAIHDATGVWLQQLPITPERVLHALQTQNMGQEQTTFEKMQIVQ
jgi:Aerobic-type carbon monoxide dehydrogenase, large subunit CoxL/CutL homologs